MTRPQLTTDQHRATLHPGPVAILAGAGTGKTTTMVERYLRLVEDGVDPTAIVAVTFTRQAAGELTARIQRALLQRRPALAARLQVAPITTFDALCRALVRTYPWAHSLDATLEVADPVLVAIEVALERDALIARALQDVGAPVSLALTQELTLAALTQPGRVLAALAHDPTSARDRHAATARTWWHEARTQLVTALEASWPSTDSQRSFVAQCQALCEAIDDHLAAARTDATGLVRELRAIQTRVRGPQPLVEVVRSLRGEVDEANSGRWRALGWTEADELVVCHQPALAAVAERAVAMLDERLALRGVATFAAMERAALEVLENPGAIAELRTRWRAVIVDEYQDVSGTQAELVERLRRVVDADLAVVGDAKQSIYGFRGAQPHHANQIAERSDVVRLDTSFRSVPAIIALANAYAASALGATDALSPAREPEAGTSSAIDVVWVQGGRAPARAAAAQTVAALVAELLAGDEDLGPRRVRAADVAVIARRWSDLEPYRRALGAAGIAVVTQGGGDLLSTEAGALVRALVRFLASPRDDLAALALARFEGIGVSDAELVALAKATEPTRPWSERLGELADQRAERLRELGDCARTRTVAEALGCARALLELDAILGHGPLGPRRLADLDAMVELVATLGEGRTILEVAELLERMVDTGSRQSRPPLPSTDAVTLTTIHDAKGLEWPIVIADNLEYRRPDRRSEGLVIDPELGVAWRDRATEAPSSLALEIREAQAQAAEAEARRLTYVALTRARDRLVVVLTEDTTPDDHLRAVLAASEARWLHIEVPDESVIGDGSESGTAPPEVPPPPVTTPRRRRAEPPSSAHATTVYGLSAQLACPALALWVGPQGAVPAPGEHRQATPLPAHLRDALGTEELTWLEHEEVLEGFGRIQVTSVVRTPRIVVVPMASREALEPEGPLVAALAAAACGVPTGGLLDLASLQLHVVEAGIPEVAGLTQRPCERCRFARRCPERTGMLRASQPTDPSRESRVRLGRTS